MYQLFFQCNLIYFTVYIAFRVTLARHSWGLYGELAFGPLPLHPKIHHRVNIDGIPTNAKNCLCLADL